MKGKRGNFPKGRRLCEELKQHYFPLLPSCFSTTALEQLKVRSGDMPVYLENMSSGPSICSPTHLYKTLRVYPPPSPPLSLSLSKNILIISNNATNRKGCGCSARSVLLAICHSKRHFQLVLDCFCCSTGSVACCNFLRGINI